MTSERIEFSAKTKRLIADRAGNQCSFPTCGRRTVSADPATASPSSDGFASHIHSAAAGGPRGRGGLTENELRSQANGIWLCGTHARLVDNNRGVAFPPEVLLSYKCLQEARVVKEHQGLYSPIGWLHEVEVGTNPLFVERQKVRLSKLNLFFGDNMTGKSALVEWILGAFEPELLKRWHGSRCKVEAKVSFLKPEPHTITTRISPPNKRTFEIDGAQVPFVPIGLRIFRLGHLCMSDDEDDLELLMRVLRLPAHAIHGLVDEIHRFSHSTIHNLRFEQEEGLKVLMLDARGTSPGLPLRMLSGREMERVMIEFITAAARVCGRYSPTCLVFDGCPSIFFEGIFEYYSHHLLDPENQFQTIMCIPSRELDLNAVFWNGWEVVRMERTSRGTQLIQDLRTANS